MDLGVDMKQHEHAEVLRAIADGKTLQWSGLDGVWRDFNPAYMAPNPIFLAAYIIISILSLYNVGSPPAKFKRTELHFIFPCNGLFVLDGLKNSYKSASNFFT
jgi:hypothetical protein